MIQAPTASARRRCLRGRDERGDYAVFIAVIASALLLFGGIAYDGPRLIAARQDALHLANEAARVAAATVASGGTVEQAREAAERRVDAVPRSEEIDVVDLKCVGSRVQITVVSVHRFRSALALAGPRVIEATGAAEAQLVLPNDQPSALSLIGECPLAG